MRNVPLHLVLAQIHHHRRPVLGALGALMLGTGVVLFVTWRREFASTSRQVIMRSLPPPRLPDHARLPGSAPRPPQP